MTFHDPKEAADWFAEQLLRNADIIVGSYTPGATRTERVLTLSTGGDVVGGWWASGGRFLSLNLIACSPHRVRPDYACPLQK
ncbi:hypothetical protein AB0C51_20425 [Streptomyces pathocidini]|uniref:hypothetical protein n=1 Tax=Streptomyces pathocidini TaxID=1650571 RepID=UPI0033D15D05